MPNPETEPNDRGQWRNPPEPELMRERIHRFATRWTKYNRLSSRKRGVFFVKAIWPDVKLLDAAEALLEAMRAAGGAGSDLPSHEIYEFTRQLPRAPIDAAQSFCFFAHRQWMIGRARLAKRLLREHHDRETAG